MNQNSKPSVSAPRLSDLAQKRLTAELRKLKKDGSFTGANEITFDPVEESLQEWSVVVKGWSHPDASENSRSFGKALESTGLDGVEFRVCFPEDYPTSPPFVYVRKPMVTFDNFFATSGSICLDVLMADGWTPATTIGSLLTTVRSHMDASIKLHSGWKDSKGLARVYNEEGARRQFSLIKSSHVLWSKPVPRVSGVKRTRV
jgi:ubiquitin-protein ligase